jgi:molybdate transport system substrate-binding protein
MTILAAMYGARAARRVVVGTSIATVATAAMVACGSSDERVVVFAASSLTDVFGRIEADYEQSHPRVDVVVNFGGSSSLVAQLGEGAPVDVLATADLPTMERASWAITADSIVFARTDLVIAVERGNPLDIRGLESLPDAALVVLAAPGVPAGAYSQQILACAGVDLKPVSLEQNVRSVAAKVSLGEADAGLVYRTDIGDDLAAVEVPSGCEVTAEYAIAPVSDEAVALDFIAYVTGPEGAAALADAGFESP